MSAAAAPATPAVAVAPAMATATAAASAAADAKAAPATAAAKPDTIRPPRVNGHTGAAASAKDKAPKQPKQPKQPKADDAKGATADGGKQQPKKKDAAKANKAKADKPAAAAGAASAAAAADDDGDDDAPVPLKGCCGGDAEAAAAAAAERTKKKRAERTNKSIGASASEKGKAASKKPPRVLPVCEFEYFDSHTHLDFIFESYDAQHKADHEKALAKEKDESKRKAMAGLALRPAAYDWYAAQNFLGNFGGCITVCCETRSIEPTLALIDADLKAATAATAAAATAAAAPADTKAAAAEAPAAGAGAAAGAGVSVGASTGAAAGASAGVSAGANKTLVLGGRIYAAFGMHPHESKHWNSDVEQRLRAIVSTHPRALAWGECGLDYYYKLSDIPVQQTAFRAQLKCAVELKKPLVIHSRDAEDDTVRIMRECVPADWPIHLHCFTGTQQMAQTMIASFSRLCIGFTGCITFGSAAQNRATVASIPLDRLLLETDGPYMAPEPFRGAISHPGMIPLTAQVMADIKGVSLQALLAQVRKNVTKIYGI